YVAPPTSSIGGGCERSTGLARGQLSERAPDAIFERDRDRPLAVSQLFKPGSIVIVVGPGGVGKTTVAAALGMAAALSGQETAVITVDPARRLRDALGLTGAASRPVR